MKKTAAAAILLLVTLSMLLAYDPRLSAMGGIGVGVSGTEMQSYANPAAVFFDDNSFTFAVNGTLGDVVGIDSWPCYPQASAGAMFVASMITAGMNVTYNAENRRPNDHVDLIQDVRLDVNIAAGYSFLSAGVGVTGGSQMQRLDVPMKVITDFPVQSLFAPFDRKVNSEYIQLRAGMMARFGQFTVGILLDNMLQKTDSGVSFVWRRIFDGTGAGVFWSSPEYSARGRMNNLVYSAGAEVRNIFKPSERTLNAGAEVRLRFVRDSGVSVRAGYSALFDSLGKGTVTAGLGVTLGHFEFAGNADFPIGGHAVLRASVTALF